MSKIFNPTTSIITKVAALVQLVAIIGAIYSFFFACNYYNSSIFLYLYIVTKWYKKDLEKPIKP